VAEVVRVRTIVAGALVLLLVAGCSSSNSSGAGSATVVGRVLSAPSCPVERAGVPCPPRPVGDAQVDAVQNGTVVASTHTDDRGRYTLRIRPGRYVIRATNAGGLATTAQRQVVVDASGPAQVIRLVVDSGIR
jgi:hypothetical protein